MDKIRLEPWHRRWWIYTRELFVRFTMRLSPARRALYAVALLLTLIGMLELFRGVQITRVLLFPFNAALPLPRWAPGALKLFLGFVAMQLLMLMEIADRLSLTEKTVKNYVSQIYSKLHVERRPQAARLATERRMRKQ